MNRHERRRLAALLAREQRQLERLSQLTSAHRHEQSEHLTPFVLRSRGLRQLEALRMTSTDDVPRSPDDKLFEEFDAEIAKTPLVFMDDLVRRKIHAASARWCSSGCPIVQMPDDFAAAMAETDPPERVLVDLRAPWRAFLIAMPEGMVTMGDQHAEYLLVHWMPWSKHPWNYFVLWSAGEERPTWIAHGHDAFLAPTMRLDDQSGDESLDLLLDRVANVVTRIAANVCLFATSHPEYVEHRIRKPLAKTGIHSRSTPSTPEFSYVVVGRPVTIDIGAARETLHAEIHGPRRGSKHRVRSIVRGHWRYQAHGPTHRLRRWKWIDPYIKGPSDGSLPLRPHRIRGHAA